MSSRGASRREWQLRAETPPLDELAAQTGLSKLALRVCFARGLKTAQEIQSFLAPELKALTDPNRIQDMDRAVLRLAQARSENQKVLIFGDYDVDGTSGAALLSWVFKECGLQFSATQPDRFKDGYGLNLGAVELAAQEGTKVLVTVDCGISSFAPAARAQELGIDLIIVDHHQIDPERGLPIAHAVVNPQRQDCTSGLRQLCGCGLAFYLACALRALGKKEGWWESGSEPNLKQHLDLVVMATAADLVPLTGDNHILVRHGLEVLKHSKKPGVQALLNASGLSSKTIAPGSLGFVIGPRINASGRILNAGVALELLTTTDPVRGMELAYQLERLNAERMELTQSIWDEVRTQVSQAIEAGRFKHGIVVWSETWHEGVVGIVASRVVEAFNRPAVVISVRDGHAKGSVRTYGGKDVLQAVRAGEKYLKGFGGHRHAAGVSLDPSQLENFAESFDMALAEIESQADALPLFVEGECSLEDLSLKALEELESLGPFGPGNPEPVFTVRAQAKDVRVLKGRHLKLNLRAAGSAQSKNSLMEAIWFHADEAQIPQGESWWACVPELNKFRGRVTPTLRIRDHRAID